MESIEYQSNIAGKNTLWIVQFDEVFPHPDGEEKFRPHFHLLYPSPLNSGRWIVLDLEKNKNDLKTMEKFQKICDDARVQCQDKLGFIGNTRKGKKETKEEVENFAQLLLYFHELMRRLKKKDPEDPESDI